MSECKWHRQWVDNQRNFMVHTIDWMTHRVTSTKVTAPNAAIDALAAEAKRLTRTLQVEFCPKGDRCVESGKGAETTMTIVLFAQIFDGYATCEADFHRQDLLGKCAKGG